MAQDVIFLNGNICYDADWSTREMTTNEVETVKDMVRSYSNVTVTGVHICEKGVEVWLAVNYLSRAKYPNNHREYQEIRSVTKEQGGQSW